MPRHVQYGIAWLGLIIGIGLITSGLFLEDTGQWRLHLLTGLWLLSLLPRYWVRTRKKRLPHNERIIVHGMVQLSLVILLCFGAVALQLTRNQVTQANDIRSRALQLFPPLPTPTPIIPTPTPIPPADRTQLGEQRTWPVEVNLGQRGTIADRSGTVLAITQEGRRVYPIPRMAQIIGFESRLFGNTGIERTFDSYLSGRRNITPAALLQSEAFGVPVEVSGADVHLTLDMRLQQVAESALGNRAGAVVLMDPHTGAILAMASYPYFDPNALMLPRQASDADVAAIQQTWDRLSERTDSPLLNRATQGLYPPGSVMKTLTAAAALDSGVVDGPEGMVTCPNRLVTENNTPPVRNAVEGLAGSTGNPSDLRRVYTWSCNTAFAQLGLQLGPERFDSYARSFGLGYADDRAPVDIRDIDATSGRIANTVASLQRPAILADTAYGQGEAMIRPLDMAQVVAVIANGGRLMRPYIVDRVQQGEEILYKTQPETIRQVISPEAAAHMRSIMHTSVQVGYAQPAALPNVSVGGKTGTAETPQGAPHSWFVGIAPVEEPRFVVAVVVEHGGEGSVSALPVARQLLAAALETP